MVDILWLVSLTYRQNSFYYHFLFHGKHTIHNCIRYFILSLNVNIYIHAFLVYNVFLLSFYFFAFNLIESMKHHRNPIEISESVSKVESALNHVNRFACFPLFLLLPFLFVALPASAATFERYATIKTSINLGLVYYSLLILYCFLVTGTVFMVIVIKQKLLNRMQ